MIDIEEIINNSQAAGEEWAKASATYHRYDKGFKTKFAQIKDKVRKAGVPPKGKWTSDDLDDATHCDPDWQVFLDDMHAAYAATVLTRVKYDNWRAALDGCRSLMANERAEKWGN